ncbi:hypothetical protein EJ110_NYTH05992 [Nymphaea thermarum]|nr:hypothetical protein EJ110_NYTH05992 [Nymphaea thermarum]
MDPDKRRKRGLLFRLCGWWLTFVLALVVSSSFAIAGGLIALILQSPSAPLPISVDSRCTILSSNIDLRSAKVCDLGFFNHKSKSALSNVERHKFRCHYDYYWASIFKVEYRQHPSGQMLHAFAEVPKEALPLDCRPSFSSAWLTKDKFKVNETYNCKYVPGMSKVDIYTDDLFNCHSEVPSPLELVGRFALLFSQVTEMFFSKSGRLGHMFVYLDAAVIFGIPSLLLLFQLLKILASAIFVLRKKPLINTLFISIYRVSLVRACFFIASLTFMGWLSIQYGRPFHLSKFFVSFSVRR